MPQVVGGFARPGLGGSRGFPKSLATWRTMTGAHRVIRGAEQSQRPVRLRKARELVSLGMRCRNNTRCPSCWLNSNPPPSPGSLPGYSALIIIWKRGPSAT